MTPDPSKEGFNVNGALRPVLPANSNSFTHSGMPSYMTQPPAQQGPRQPSVHDIDIHTRGIPYLSTSHNSMYQGGSNYGQHFGQQRPLQSIQRTSSYQHGQIDTANNGTSPESLQSPTSPMMVSPQYHHVNTSFSMNTNTQGQPQSSSSNGPAGHNQGDMNRSAYPGGGWIGFPQQQGPVPQPNRYASPDSVTGQQQGYHNG